MNNKEWLELIKSKEEEILEALAQAYTSACKERHLRYIVEIRDNGDIETWYDVAGGNSYHVNREHDILEIGQFCEQYTNSVYLSDDDVESAIADDVVFAEMVKVAKENDYNSVEDLILNDSDYEQYRQVLSDAEQSIKQDLAEESKWDAAQAKLDRCIEVLEQRM